MGSQVALNRHAILDDDQIYYSWNSEFRVFMAKMWVFLSGSPSLTLKQQNEQNICFSLMSS